MDNDSPSYVPPSDATILRYLKREKKRLVQMLKRERERKAKIATLRKETDDLSEELFALRHPEERVSA
jgi:hypothetical protein